MSWAEVKKFLNAEKTPLNKLIRKFCEPKYSECLVGATTITNTSGANSDVVILDITGAGVLRSVGFFTDDYTGNAKVVMSITADGKTTTMSAKCSYDGRYIGVGYVPIDNGAGNYFTIPTNDLVPPMEFGATGTNRYRVPFGANKNYNLETDSTSFTIACTTPKPLVFKESLKITIKLIPSAKCNAYANWCYELE